jgi:hypothetical protein
MSIDDVAALADGGSGSMNGPFRTLREAKADDEATVLREAEIAVAQQERR